MSVAFDAGDSENIRDLKTIVFNLLKQRNSIIFMLNKQDVDKRIIHECVNPLMDNISELENIILEMEHNG